MGTCLGNRLPWYVSNGCQWSVSHNQNVVGTQSCWNVWIVQLLSLKFLKCFCFLWDRIKILISPEMFPTRLLPCHSLSPISVFNPMESLKTLKVLNPFLPLHFQHTVCFPWGVFSPSLPFTFLCWSTPLALELSALLLLLYKASLNPQCWFRLVPVYTSSHTNSPTPRLLRSFTIWTVSSLKTDVMPVIWIPSPYTLHRAAGQLSGVERISCLCLFIGELNCHQTEQASRIGCLIKNRILTLEEPQQKDLRGV